MSDGELSIYPVPADKVDAVWPSIREFVQEAAQYDPDHTSEDRILASLLTNESFLHVAFRDGEATGFTVSFYNPDHLFIWAHGGRDTFAHLEQFMSDLADNGIRKVRFGSPRRGFERLAEKLGFEKSTVIYERELDVES